MTPVGDLDRARCPGSGAVGVGARDAGLPGIASFAKGLEQDLNAVTSGLTMPLGAPVRLRAA